MYPPAFNAPLNIGPRPGKNIVLRLAAVGKAKAWLCAHKDLQKLYPGLTGLSGPGENSHGSFSDVTMRLSSLLEQEVDVTDICQYGANQSQFQIKFIYQSVGK